MPLNHHYGCQMCRFTLKKKKKQSWVLSAIDSESQLRARRGNTNPFTQAHTCTASVINTLYIAAHLQFWIINTVLWGCHTCTKHKHIPPLSHFTGQCKDVHGKHARVEDQEWGRGGVNIKCHSKEGQMVTRLESLKTRLTLLDTSLALARVFTDKKYAERPCVCACACCVRVCVGARVYMCVCACMCSGGS